MNLIMVFRDNEIDNDRTILTRFVIFEKTRKNHLLESVLNASIRISEYNSQVASANYVVCNPEIYRILKGLL